MYVIGSSTGLRRMSAIAVPQGRCITPILYRPFDRRFIYYTGRSRGFIGWPVVNVMGHMLAGENQALCIGRAGQVIGSGVWDVLFASTFPSELNLFRRGGNCLFPLYLYPGVGKADRSLFRRWGKGKDGRTPNLDSGFVEQIAAATELRFVSDGRGDLREAFGAEDVFAYIYTVFHSPGYRSRYEAQLKLDFPRVPLPGSVDLFRQLAEAGHDLLALHLLESPKLGKPHHHLHRPEEPRGRPCRLVERHGLARRRQDQRPRGPPRDQARHDLLTGRARGDLGLPHRRLPGLPQVALKTERDALSRTRTSPTIRRSSSP